MKQKNKRQVLVTDRDPNARLEIILVGEKIFYKQNVILG